MSALAELLAAEFESGDVLQFQGRGGMTFDYIEDETVMDRLDDVLGVGRWSITVEPISLADGVVKVRLAATLPDGSTSVYEDFGYQTREGGEGLKEAVSDGIRRCGRYLGVGRYLYRKHVSPAGRAAPPPARLAPRPVPVSSPAGAGRAEPPLDFGDGPAAGDDGVCPDHGLAWDLKAAGVGKNGPYDAFWRCTGRTKDGYCRKTPSKAWEVARQARELDDLPF